MGENHRAVSVRGLFADLGRTLSDAFGGYRPERHYMRGPGPKWREKHGLSEEASPPWLLAPAPPTELAVLPTRAKLG